MRHGLTDWNFAGRVQGGLDKSRLNPEGMRQAKEAGKNLTDVQVDAVFCSPLTRAKETFNIAMQNSKNPAFASIQHQILPSLSEIQVPWQGLLKNEISTSFYADAYAKYLRNPRWFSYNGFSPFDDITARAEEVWNVVSRANHSCSLIVGHNQMNKALICSQLGMQFSLSSWRQNNCCFNVFRYEPGRPSQLRLSNSSDVEYIARKPTPRRGFMRVILHRNGGFTGLKNMTRTHRIARYFVVGDTDPDYVASFRHDFAADGEVSHLPWLKARSIDEDFEHAVRLLERLKGSYRDQCVVLSVGTAERICSLISACVGLGVHGVRRFYSDPGGVTIIDLNSTAKVGSVASFVACHNVGAWPSLGPLVGYTQNNNT